MNLQNEIFIIKKWHTCINRIQKKGFGGILSVSLCQGNILVWLIVNDDND